MSRQGAKIPQDEIIRRCEKWQTNVSWPAPIDHRLDDLVRLAVEAGEPAGLSRSELLTALVFDADADGEELSRLLRRYRTAQVKDLVVSEHDKGADVIELATRRPGRRA